MASVVPTDFAGVLDACGFNAQARTRIVEVTRENLEMSNLLDFTEDDDFESLFSSLRKPGGQIGDGTSGNPHRTDPGVFVSARAADGFWTICYMAQHRALWVETIYSSPIIRQQAFVPGSNIDLMKLAIKILKRKLSWQSLMRPRSWTLLRSLRRTCPSLPGQVEDP